MIMNFRHKGLRDLFLLGKTSGVIPTQVKRLRHRLAVIDAASCLADIDMPGYRLHPLSAIAMEFGRYLSRATGG